MKGLYLENKENTIDRFADPIWKGIESALGSDDLVRKPTDVSSSSSYHYKKGTKSPDDFDFASDSFPRNDEGFCFTVSLHDAITLHVTNRITMNLGYPIDMLKGQCILNYLYPRDRLTFANHLSQGLQSRFATQDTKCEEKIVFYVRIREYKALSGGFGVVERKGVYRPFQLTCVVKDIILGKQDNPKLVNEQTTTVCLVASASPIHPAHKVPNEKNPAMTPFSSRHTSSCHYSHMDTCSIPYLGYLPQDIVGYSVFDFYHQDDLHLIRDIYQLVVREEGLSFRSKPYRFRVFNGDYITLETDWSSFINPWSRRMEFVIGHHRIVDGPSNPNVFAESEQKVYFENPVEKQHLQEEVRNLLSKPIKHYYGKMPANQRKRNLAAFVSNIIDGIEVTPVSGQECYCSDHESVVMGAISPHQDDSDESSETPASFQQMRLQDNIERFFNSQPKTNCAPSSSSGLSPSTTQNSSLYGSGSNDDSSNPRKTYNSMDSGINGTSSNSFEKAKNTVKKLAEGPNCKASVTIESKSKKSEHWKNAASSGPVHSNCVSLTEEVLSHHNKIISKRFTKSTGQGCNKVPKKMETSKFKRAAFNSVESIIHSKPKQACFHTESRRKFNSNGRAAHHNVMPTSFSGINLSSHEKMSQVWPIGFPVLVKPTFSLNNLHRSLSYDRPGANQPHLVMAPIMCLTAPALTISHDSTGESSGVGGSGGSSALGGSGGSGGDAGIRGGFTSSGGGRTSGYCDKSFQHASLNKRNIKPQTDLTYQFDSMDPKSIFKGLNFQESLSKKYRQFKSSEVTQSTQISAENSAENSAGTFSLSEETSDYSVSAHGNFFSRKMLGAGKDSDASPSVASCDSSFKYTIPLPDLEFTLKKDYALLENMDQPVVVKKQLMALGSELRLDINKTDDRDLMSDDESYNHLVSCNIMEENVTEKITQQEDQALYSIGITGYQFPL